jgi:chitinase
MSRTRPPYVHHYTIFSTPLDNMYWNAVYYPNWRIYRDQPPVSLNFDVISHVFYAFAWQVWSPRLLPVADSRLG